MSVIKINQNNQDQSSTRADTRAQTRSYETQTPASFQFSSHAERAGLPLASASQRLRAGLESKLGRNKVRRYLGDSESTNGSSGVELAMDEQGVCVRATNRFTLDMIEKQIGEDLRSTYREQSGNPAADVRFSLMDSDHAGSAIEAKSFRGTSDLNSTQVPASSPTPGRHAGNPRVSNLIAGQAPSRNAPRKAQPACPSIEGFLVGAANKLAIGAVKALLESPGACPPVYIHGSCGLGKTHLLRAAGQRYRQMVPGSKVRYITGEAFTNSFVQAIRTKTVDAFEKKFKGLDVLCLDDVHMVAGKESTQHELLQIFNTLSLSGAKVIIASDAPPNEIARLNSGLASRFNGGVVARIDAPDRDLGLRIARQICLVRGMSIDDAGLGAILDRTGVGQGASVRELEGAIVQVQAVARLLDQDQHGGPTLTSIHRALQLRCGTESAGASRGPIPIDLIMKVVCEHLGVTRQDLGGRGRHRTVVLARELIVHLARELTTNSFPEIAHSIGRPNHSTVITAAKRIKTRIENLELCTPMGPTSGVTVKGLVDELCERVRMTHRQQGERV
ncbi:MAG: DnaA ATPase domain-containing protein [Phycisphaerales bacterium]